VETPEREVEVYRAELLEAEGDRATFEVECSAGTYVRTLLEELGDAYCQDLRRIAIGSLRIEDAGAEISPNEALGHLPAIELDDEAARRASSGQALPAPEGPAGPERARLVFGGKLLAVVRREGDELRPETVLA
jgi:tRNA pseudouridine55 synthase